MITRYWILLYGKKDWCNS